MKFAIYHPIDGQLNHNEDKTMFNKIITLDVTDINEAWQMSQNDFNRTYRRCKVRSTSQGDIIVNETEGECFLIKGIGFERITLQFDAMIPGLAKFKNHPPVPPSNMDNSTLVHIAAVAENCELIDTVREMLVAQGDKLVTVITTCSLGTVEMLIVQPT